MNLIIMIFSMLEQQKRYVLEKATVPSLETQFINKYSRHSDMLTSVYVRHSPMLVLLEHKYWGLLIATCTMVVSVA
jgi:hypothetical protein